MYTQLFKLSEAPFRLTPDPQFLFMSTHHAQVVILSELRITLMLLLILCMLLLNHTLSMSNPMFILLPVVFQRQQSLQRFLVRIFPVGLQSIHKLCPAHSR